MATGMNAFENLLRVLEDLYGRDSVREFFKPPCSEAEIAQAEAQLGYSLPEDLKQVYRITDGIFIPEGEGPRPPMEGIFADSCNGSEILSLKWLLRLTQSKVGSYPDYEASWDEGRKVRTMVVNPRWPAFASGVDTRIMIDLDPGPEGRMGQLIIYASGDPWPKYYASGFSDYLNAFASAVERGQIRQGLRDKDENCWVLAATGESLYGDSDDFKVQLRIPGLS